MNSTLRQRDYRLKRHKLNVWSLGRAKGKAPRYVRTGLKLATACELGPVQLTMCLFKEA